MILLSLASLAIGARSVPLATVVDALTRYDPTSTDQLVVVTADPVLLGHVLGIRHTGRPECVMFPIPQRSAFCAADVESARRWYAMPAGVVASQAAAQR